jgi:hypothetical protein
MRVFGYLENGHDGRFSSIIVDFGLGTVLIIDTIKGEVVSGKHIVILKVFAGIRRV